LFIFSLFKANLPSGQAIHEQLDRMDIKPSQLYYVILTHLHVDHVSRLDHVKEAKRIMTSEIEWEVAQKQIGYVPALWKNINVQTFSVQPILYGPYRLGLDLFQDGSIFLVYTPGHSHGHISILVKKEEGYLLLASDTALSSLSWEQNVLQGDF
jgi:glyoxylase-like metal-dependent hydrolase (beta-lactamase superfamily II)